MSRGEYTEDCRKDKKMHFPWDLGELKISFQPSRQAAMGMFPHTLSRDSPLSE
jgi:hypothetical protein